MGIRTKFNPMGGKNGKKYKAYLLSGETAVDVATLGFTEPINLNTTKGTSYDCSPCNYVILNGKLYYCSSQSSLQRVGNFTDWTDVTGYVNDDARSYAHGIAGGKLYKIHGTEATQVSSTTNWTKVSGYYDYQNSIYPYGISGGRLYIITSTISRVGSATNWTDINGFASSKYNAYGFNSDTLYRINNRSDSAVDSLSWTKISGYSSYEIGPRPPICAYGIANGKLYCLYASSKQQVGSATNWTDISGFSGYLARMDFAIGISGGKLYSIASTDRITTKQIGSLTDWTKVSGTVSPFSIDISYTAYGIRNGNIYNLYSIVSGSSSSVVAADLSIPNCVEIYGCSYNQPSILYLPALAICEQ